ncbi:MAG: carboxypeptidase-like regulatory domain-containing protein, partial [Butyricimonas faecihominis]
MKDKQGESLIGVTVLVKGTSIGAVTDSLGRYKITLPEQQDLVLIFSFIGMQSKEVKINNQKEINVTLEEDIETLEEVVVSTGYYNRKKESYTGATTSFTGDKLRMVSSGNVLSTLSVLDPSFKLLDNIEMGSDPNTIPEFTIRGGG